jgi:hypothetical protein
MESCVHVRRLSGFLLADFDLGFSAEAVSEPPLCCVTGAALKTPVGPGTVAAGAAMASNEEVGL